jgi:hypothetical protein
LQSLPQVPECPSITATAAPGSTYLDAVFGSAPPEYMFTFDEASSSATVANYVEGMFAAPKGVAGTRSAAGTTLGVPGLLPADNRTAVQVDTSSQGSISFPSLAKVCAVHGVGVCLVSDPDPPPHRGRQLLRGGHAEPASHMAHTHGTTCIAHALVHEALLVAGGERWGDGDTSVTCPCAPWLVWVQLDPELGGTFQFWIRLLTANTNTTSTCTIVSDRVVSPVDGSVTASIVIGIDSTNRLRARFWTSEWRMSWL